MSYSGNSSNNNNNNNNNLPESNSSSRSSSPSLHYVSYESEIRHINNNNNNNNSSNNTNTNSRFQRVPVITVELENMDSQADQPTKSRFDVEKVQEEEKTNLLSTNNFHNEFEQNPHNDTITSQTSKKSALKKTNYQNDVAETVIPKPPHFDDEDDDDDEVANCVKINYNKKKEARSVTVNFGSPTLNSYMNCCNDIKSLTFYKKLFAEYIGKN